jgi:hypothetical protein
MEGWGYLVCGSRSNLLRLYPTVGGAVNNDRDSRNNPAGYFWLSIERICGLNEQAGNYSEQDRAKSQPKPRLTPIMKVAPFSFPPSIVERRGCQWEELGLCGGYSRPDHGDATAGSRR